MCSCRAVPDADAAAGSGSLARLGASSGVEWPISPRGHHGVVLDYDAAGNLVGIDIDHASQRVALQRLVVSRLPGELERIAG